MTTYKVGQRVSDYQAGGAPIGTVLVHEGAGYFEILKLPPEPLKVGDAIGTAAQAARLPVGSVVVDTGPDRPACLSAVKVADRRWMFYSRYYGATTEDDGFMGRPHRIVYIPSADAGAGGAEA